MFGVVVNTVTVILGSIVGMLFSKFISEKYTTAIMTAIGLCTLYIGFDGALAGKNTLVLIISLAVGTAVGTLFGIDDGINALGAFIEKKFKRNDGKASVAQGFVTASLLFCIGSMTIVGSLNAGISGDNTLLLTKSVLDLISSCVLAASMGIGVLCSAVFVLVFQGGLVLLAGFIGPFLSASAQAELICAGSVMIIALGLNLIGITKIKVANMLPALILAPILEYPLSLLMKAIGL